jgi:hypothetical protein
MERTDPPRISVFSRYNAFASVHARSLWPSLILFSLGVMTPREEEYLHYKECSDSLNSAWRICKELVSTRPAPVIHDAALRFALIAYARSYTRSDGTHRSGRRAYRRPTPSFLSPAQLQLHTQILDLRDQELAHCDLTVRNARVSLRRTRGIPHACIAQNCSTTLPDLHSVIALTEATLDMLYSERAKFLDDIAPNTEPIAMRPTAR